MDAWSEMPKTEATREYSAAGGVVVRCLDARVLALLRPTRLAPDGQPEVRLPKGHIEPGESPEATALREVEEEAGLSELELLVDLGDQTVCFEWKGHRYRRTESYFLMRMTNESRISTSERQFRRLWLSWEEALRLLSYSAEREWLRRARDKWQLLAGR